MGLFDDLFDQLQKRRLDTALKSGTFWKIVIAAIGDRRQIRQYAAELLVPVLTDRAAYPNLLSARQ